VDALNPGIAAGEVCGIEIEAGGVPRAAAIELAEGGAAPMIVLAVAGDVLAAARDCGTDCVEGSAGAADRATSEAFSGVVSCFHQAQRGPDWQPTSATIARTIQRARFARELIGWLPFRLATCSTGYLLDWLASRLACFSIGDRWHGEVDLRIGGCDLLPAGFCDP
jgi:hypothetical protein